MKRDIIDEILRNLNDNLIHKALQEGLNMSSFKVEADVDSTLKILMDLDIVIEGNI